MFISSLRTSQFWRKKKEGRRHPAMVYKEKTAEMAERNKQLDRDEYRKKEKKRRKQKLRKEVRRRAERVEWEVTLWYCRNDIEIGTGNVTCGGISAYNLSCSSPRSLQILRKRHADFMAHVAKVDQERKDMDQAKRSRDTAALNLRMNLFEKWGVEAAERKRKEKEAFDKSEKKRKKKEEKDARKAAKQKAEDDAEVDRMAGLKLTQETLTMMQQYGIVMASNSQEPEEQDPQVRSCKAQGSNFLFLIPPIQPLMRLAMLVAEADRLKGHAD